jgi:hypothetical protein
VLALEAKPVGVARPIARLVEKLPANLQDVLPAPHDIETELGQAKKRAIGRRT